MKRPISLILALCLCLGLASGAFAAADADKEETVRVQADAEGNVRSVTVEAVLHYDGDGGRIEDRSTLADIKNTEGDEEFAREGEALLWDDHGEAIRYKGTSSAPLPVGVQVSYYLDGARVSPAELAGRSGHVRIRFDYTNSTRRTVTVTHPAREADSEDDEPQPETTEEVETCIPFLALTLVMLPEDVFTHVEVTNGRLVSLGGASVAIGCALPGLSERLSLGGYELTEEVELPGYVEIEADAEAFELDFTATILSNGLFSELDTGDLDELDELTDGMADLTEASAALADGARELADGADEFSGYVTEYTDGAVSLAEGAAALDTGVSALAGQTAALTDGAAALQAGLDSLQTAVAGVTAPDTSALSTALAALIADASALGGILASLQGDLDGLDTYANGVTDAVSGADAALAGISFDISAALGALDLTDEQRQAVEDAVAGTLSAAEDGVAAARGYLADVPTLYRPDIGAYAASAAEIAADLSSQTAALQTAAAALSAADALPTALTDGLVQLAAGAAALSTGAAAFAAGVDRLAEGAAALHTGAAALGSSGTALAEAADALSDGASELADALAEFDEEGISELAKLADDDLAVLVTELRALRVADEAFDNFSGLAEGRTGSVRFLIETDGIE